MVNEKLQCPQDPSTTVSFILFYQRVYTKTLTQGRCICFLGVPGGEEKVMQSGHFLLIVLEKTHYPLFLFSKILEYKEAAGVKISLIISIFLLLLCQHFFSHISIFSTCLYLSSLTFSALLSFTFCYYETP